MTAIDPETKIWRYMDLAKFVSMLATRTLYFACPTQFEDKWEGYVPNRESDYLLSPARININMVDLTKNEDGLKALKWYRDKLSAGMCSAGISLGVSCWHQNATESDAMWKLYSLAGQGIAIESTVGRLKDSLGKMEYELDWVKYVDFDTMPLSESMSEYVLRKRKTFEYEREIRALITLPTPGTGVAVKCDLDALIVAIHISPIADGYFTESVRAVCTGNIKGIVAQPTQSQLHAPPDSSHLEALRRQLTGNGDESATS